MIRQEDVYRIGRIGKPHGVKGEVSFQFDDDIFDRIDSDYLIIEIDGILVPFFMEEYRFRSDTLALVKFEGIDTQERAKELTNAEVFFPREHIGDEDTPLSWAAIVGFRLIDDATGDCVGRIASVDDSTQNILFELEDGKLIPASEDLITNVDTQKKAITIDLPEGILEL